MLCKIPFLVCLKKRVYWCLLKKKTSVGVLFDHAFANEPLSTNAPSFTWPSRRAAGSQGDRWRYIAWCYFIFCCELAVHSFGFTWLGLDSLWLHQLICFANETRGIAAIKCNWYIEHLSLIPLYHKQTSIMQLQISPLALNLLNLLLVVTIFGSKCEKLFKALYLLWDANPFLMQFMYLFGFFFF